MLLPNITPHRCNKLNSATLLPEESEVNDEKLDCIVLTDNLLFPRTDLQESPMNNPDFILFADSS